MFNLLLIVFVFVALTVILAITIIGAVIFRKKSVQPNPRIDHENIIDVTAKDEK